MTNKRKAAAQAPAPVVDVEVQNEGSIFLLRPLSDAGRQWLDTNIQSDAMTFGNATVCEHRYVEDIVLGMVNDGLNVTYC